MPNDKIGIFDFFENYGHYVCNIGKIMDELGISVSKMSKLTGLNHDIVKKYYKDQIIRVDKDVLSKMSFVIMTYGKDSKNILEYIPPKNNSLKGN